LVGPGERQDCCRTGLEPEHDGGKTDQRGSGSRSGGSRIDRGSEVSVARAAISFGIEEATAAQVMIRRK
jgi:hypothetical protein